MNPSGTVVFQPSFDDNQSQKAFPLKSATSSPSTQPEHNVQLRKTDERTVPGHVAITANNAESAIDVVRSRKHRRDFSGDQFEPPVAHRRINSNGKATVVDRATGRSRQHNRVDSGGLDMLSAAASVGISKSDFDAAAYKQHPFSHSPMNDPYRMHLPQMRHVGPPPPRLPYAAVSHYAAYPAPAGNPYFAGLPGRPMAPFPYAHGEHHSVMNERQRSVDFGEDSTDAYHQQQGSQPFVTAMALGNGEKTILPSTGAHHRKLSSISLSALFGPALFGGSEPHANLHPLKDGRHRATSSSISFLDSMGDVDDSFLRNLQAADAEVATELGVSRAAASSDSKLASGGASKRVRRKCSMEGCGNRVVQGGLCITHGAKRKTCKHPGCDKNVKKAGLCSTHGPSRKRCDAKGCDKVAVQGGRCISHGAKKRVCSVDNCTKQAILSGMCKKHHDKLSSERKLDPASDTTTSIPNRQHTRGLSIFQEISADTVQSILNDDEDEK